MCLTANAHRQAHMHTYAPSPRGLEHPVLGYQSVGQRCVQLPAQIGNKRRELDATGFFAAIFLHDNGPTIAC
jgi:hypothetical protein